MRPWPWLYISRRGYAWLYVVIYCICTEKVSEPHSDSQGGAPVIMTSPTGQKPKTVVLCGYTTQDVVIQLILLLVRQHLTRKKQSCLCVRDHGYTSHIVVMRGYTWLYAAYALKRCENYIVTVKVVCSLPWCQQLVENTRRRFYMVIRTKPWLYALVRGYTTRSSPHTTAA